MCNNEVMCAPSLAKGQGKNIPDKESHLPRSQRPQGAGWASIIAGVVRLRRECWGPWMGWQGSDLEGTVGEFRHILGAMGGYLWVLS